MTPTPEQIEAVARAIADSATYPFDDLYPPAQEKLRRHATAAIAAARVFIRAEALEEAARVATGMVWQSHGALAVAPHGAAQQAADEIAAAIRALKEKKDV